MKIEFDTKREEEIFREILKDADITNIRPELMTEAYKSWWIIMPELKCDDCPFPNVDCSPSKYNPKGYFKECIVN